MKEVRQLDVVLHSATGLKSASKMSVYCVAWIEPSVRVPSPNTKAHGTHPEFNTTISMSLDDRILGRGQHLNLEILGHGLVSTRRVGFVRVSLSELLQESSNGDSVHTQFNAHPVSTNPHGLPHTLNYIGLYSLKYIILMSNQTSHSKLYCTKRLFPVHVRDSSHS